MQNFPGILMTRNLLEWIWGGFRSFIWSCLKGFCFSLEVQASDSAVRPTSFFVALQLFTDLFRGVPLKQHHHRPCLVSKW